MSINLHCNKVKLMQTPMHITNMCLMTEDGYAMSAIGGYAKQALGSYLEWYQALGNDRYVSPVSQEEIKSMEQNKILKDAHVKEVLEIIKDPDLEVYQR